MMNAIKCLFENQKSTSSTRVGRGGEGGGIIKSFVPHGGRGGGGYLPICPSGGGGGDRSRVG